MAVGRDSVELALHRLVRTLPTSSRPLMGWGETLSSWRCIGS